jgi:hypothetical protein
LTSLVLVHAIYSQTFTIDDDPSRDETAALTYTSTATGGSAVLVLPNSMGGGDFEIVMPVRFAAKASERPDGD